MSRAAGQGSGGGDRARSAHFVYKNTVLEGGQGTYVRGWGLRRSSMQLHPPACQPRGRRAEAKQRLSRLATPGPASALLLLRLPRDETSRNWGGKGEERTKNNRSRTAWVNSYFGVRNSQQLGLIKC